MDVGKEREQERKLFRRVWRVFAGNAGFRYRSNRLIPAYWTNSQAPAWEFSVGSSSFLSRKAGAWEPA
jgi:hypothetical protein